MGTGGLGYGERIEERVDLHEKAMRGTGYFIS